MRKAIKGMVKAGLISGALCIMLVIIVFGIVAAMSSTKPENEAGADVQIGTPVSIARGVASKDASADVGQPTIEDAGYGFYNVAVDVTNNSSKRSDYFITVAVESPDGTTRYDSTTIPVMGLEPGQTTSEKMPLLADTLPADATAVVKEVQRTAS